MRSGIRTLAFVGLFGTSALVFTPSAVADDTAAKSAAVAGKAKSPRACVEGMIACAKSHDVDGLCAFFAEPFRSTMPKMLKAQQAGQAADEKLVKALQAKFGEDASSDFRIRQRPGMFEGDIQIGEVAEQGDTATVKLKIASAQEGRPAREQTVELARVDGVWFAKPPAFGGGRGRGQGPGTGGGDGQGSGAGQGQGQGRGDRPEITPEQRAQMQEARMAAQAQAAAETDALAGDITAGKVASKEDAKKRFDEIRSRLRPAGAGGPRGGPQGDRPDGGRPGAPAPKPETPKRGDF